MLSAVPSAQARRGYLELPLRRLSAVGLLTGEEMQAIRALPSARVKLPKGAALVAPGAGPHFILDGWGCQLRELTADRRQIFSFVLPGDLIGQLSGDGAPQTEFGYQALTPVTLIDAGSLCAIAPGGGWVHPGIEAAMAGLRARACSRLFDHIVRLGIHTAYEGMAHLLIELHDRQAEIGLSQDGRFGFPIGQERLGEMLGLSAVHVSRTLTKLKADGFLLAGPGWLALPRRAELAKQIA